MSAQKFYRCKHCGNLVAMMNDSGVPMICCGEPMQELTPNTVEASAEKHIPAVTVSGSVVTVQVGSVPHPMVAEHHIEFIWLHTQAGGQLHRLAPGEAPTATFHLDSGDVPVAVYEFCNIHGLWMAQVNTNLA